MRPIPSGSVRFFYGPMDCGKSTLALQIHDNQVRQGRRGVLLTRFDRSGPARISSRIGLSSPALEVTGDLDLTAVLDTAAAAGAVDYVVVDEAQFLTPAQVDQLALAADEREIEVFAFGIATDFRSRLFPGSARLFEVADRVDPVQVDVLCWCGRPGRFNARLSGGRITLQGPTIVIADTGDPVAPGPEPAGGTPVYRVLCRRHYRSGELGPADPDAGEPDLAGAGHGG